MFDCAVPAERKLGIGAAVDAVRRGDLVVLPTDTVYGLGCDAFTPRAVDRLLVAKGRGRDMPVPVLVGSWHTVDGLVDRKPEGARALIRAFWPGALTLVLRHTRTLAWDLGDAAGTVAVRMPLHPVALEVLRETGPMAVSSANRSGEPPASSIADARRQLGEAVAVYLDGGPSGDPVPSTIVDLSGDGPPIVLRVGAIPVGDLRRIVADLTGP